MLRLPELDLPFSKSQRLFSVTPAPRPDGLGVLDGTYIPISFPLAPVPNEDTYPKLFLLVSFGAPTDFCQIEFAAGDPCNSLPCRPTEGLPFLDRGEP
jgi:hypothetical protein